LDTIREPVLILAREETADVSALCAALGERGHDAVFAVPGDIVVRCGPEGVSFALREQPIAPRCVLGWVSLWQREYGLWVLRAFADAGVLVLNTADVLDLGQNKFLGSVRMACAGIPHIRTALLGSVDQLARTIDELGLPLVLKPIVGAKGDDVVCIGDVAELYRVAADYIARYHAAYVQQYVEKGGRDIRVRVVDHRAYSAVYRYAAPGAFLTNLAKGGRDEVCPLTPELAALAERCSRVFDAPVAGIDVLSDPSGTLRVIEVNVTPMLVYPPDESIPLAVDYIERALGARHREAVPARGRAS
jgi:RimK family alpha-L-glutamate ligase